VKYEASGLISLVSVCMIFGRVPSFKARFPASVSTITFKHIRMLSSLKRCFELFNLKGWIQAVHFRRYVFGRWYSNFGPKSWSQARESIPFAAGGRDFYSERVVNRGGGNVGRLGDQSERRRG